ncbi:MAG: hypothetical protein II802_04385 [Clostridia bacterium]|nr:hypothetical protein [Clostridia bacterium]
MALCEKPTHIFEPTPLQCGQAVLAMLSSERVERIIEIVGTERETTLKDMKNALCELGIEYSCERKQAEKINDLPPIALLSLETPHCWHWSLYFKGIFYDPEYGVLTSFPPSQRKYFWEIKNNSDG